MNIAVFLPNWIGDAVMATPVLRALRRQFAGAHFIGVLKPYVAGVLDGTPWFDELIYLDKCGDRSRRWPGVAWKLRQKKIDLAVIFPNSFRTALVAWLGRCRRRIGYRRYRRGWLLTDALEPVRDVFGGLKPSPVIDAYIRLAEAAGCVVTDYQMQLGVSDEDEKNADAIWNQFDLARYSEVVCLNPGAAFGAAKHWPLQHFAALASTIVDERGSGVLVLCGPNERDQARTITDLAQRTGIHSLADTTLSIGLTKACIKRCDLLVTTDSGPRHFAAAFDRPVVSLFGPTHIPWTITYHDKEICLQKKVPCGPCQLRVCPLDHRCMNDLLPDEVFHAADHLLTKCSPRRAPSVPEFTPTPLPIRKVS